MGGDGLKDFPSLLGIGLANPRGWVIGMSTMEIESQISSLEDRLLIMEVPLQAVKAATAILRVLRPELGFPKLKQCVRSVLELSRRFCWILDIPGIGYCLRTARPALECLGSDFSMEALEANGLPRKPTEYTVLCVDASKERRVVSNFQVLILLTTLAREFIGEYTGISERHTDKLVDMFFSHAQREYFDSRFCRAVGMPSLELEDPEKPGDSWDYIFSRVKKFVGDDEFPTIRKAIQIARELHYLISQHSPSSVSRARANEAPILLPHYGQTQTNGRGSSHGNDAWKEHAECDPPFAPLTSPSNSEGEDGDAEEIVQQVGSISSTADLEAHLGDLPMALVRRRANAAARSASQWLRVPDQWDVLAVEEAKERFCDSSKAFKHALDPYVLRRDKREDTTIKAFADYTGEGHHAYRKISEVRVELEQLTTAWKRAVCAAESLSFVTKHAEDAVAKRLRLTLGNGHGIADFLHQSEDEEKEGRPAPVVDGVSTMEDEGENDPKSAKRFERAQWWRNVMLAPYRGDEPAETALYEHPAILAAVKSIEASCKAGEKVLVFGRFNQPLRALVNLLNARKMLRDLGDGRVWSQQQVHESEWTAVEVAHRQLDRPGTLNRSQIDALLKDSYTSLESNRRRFRDNLVASLESGVTAMSPSIRRLFEVFKNDMATESTSAQSLASIARALADHLGNSVDEVTPVELAQAFTELVTAASDADPDESDVDDAQAEAVAVSRWNYIEARIKEDYSHTRGGFARLMNGDTRTGTRRLLQLAFNRKHAFPQVLVAQSVVGREGLNLHKACRTVLLLHPEWNPGVVEQQIGRVDRLGSLWEAMLAEGIRERVESSKIPRIEIKPVVFEGTYDESNWRVLKERWDELRAQLHGIILSYPDNPIDPGVRAVFDEINAMAPNFSPGSLEGELP